MRKILVIEDNEKNMYLMRFLLESDGFEVIEARTGEKGVELANTVDADLIIMDVKLPGIDGLEATKEIRKTLNYDEMPIIAVTSYALPGDKKRALDVGCNGYLTKPINPETFMDDVRKFLK